ncbi:hypothetical protein ACN28S_21470 [Cystobacter fuscus]
MARITVVTAYHALADEGYVELEERRAPRVVDVPPEARMNVAARARAAGGTRTSEDLLPCAPTAPHGPRRVAVV